MIHLLLADGNGYDSVADVIDKNKKDITVIELRNYEHFDTYTMGILIKCKDGDIVVLDTISSLANTTRGDFKLGNDPSVSYWEQKQKYFGDKNYQTNYEAAGQMIMRRLKDLKAVGYKLIVTAHEKEVKDESVVPAMTKRGPEINDALRGNLIGSSSDVVRLRVNYDPVFDGEGNVKFPTNSRMLQLGPSEEFVSKFHVALDKSTKLQGAEISKPSYPKLCKVLGKQPTWLTIYGPPGTGKTTFCVSKLMDAEGNGIGL